MKQRRKISYITGTRADFGLMCSTLQKLATDDAFTLSILATGMHLSARYGATVSEIEAAGLPAPIRIPVDDANEPSGWLMAHNIGLMLIGLTDALRAEAPDLVLLLGDRGEMLAGAIAALHLNIRIAHIHGGERSGTVDEPIRHAISKLSHIHFVASEESAERLRHMGERPETIHVVGAPGLDGLQSLANKDRAALACQFGFDAARPMALLVFHPVVQEAGDSAAQITIALEALAACGLQIVALAPNSDAGSAEVRSVLERSAGCGAIRLETHLARSDFVSLMQAADVMIGNSSSGIIEAATFGTPVVNLGSRQNLRQRNANVIDAPIARDAVIDAIERALAAPRMPGQNVFGSGGAGDRIVAQLRALDFLSDDLVKTNAY